MKKKFNIEVDCANCAQKVEDAVNKLPGVTAATVSFMTQKMTLEADEGKMDHVVEEARKIIGKIESDVVVKERR